MTIERESILVNCLEEKLKTEFKTNFSLREFSVGYGIADLVLARNYIFAAESTAYIPVVSYDGFLLLNRTFRSQKVYTLREIEHLNSGINTSRIRKIIRSLIQVNVIEEIAVNSYQRNTLINFTNPIDRTIAIEAKLSDAKNGLIQARRYQYFADECYLAILKENINRVDWDVLEQENIGLISYDAHHSKIKFERRPGRNYKHIDALGAYAKELMMHRYSNLALELQG